MALYRCGMVGTKIKHGLITNVSANTEYTINTGLTEVKQFHVWQGVHPANSEYMAFCHYDKEHNVSKFVAGGRKSGSGTSNNSYQSIGASNTNMRPTIVSITGGVVVYKTGTNTSSDVGDIRWYAE